MVLIPAVSMQSLMVKGTPCSGPHDSPRMTAASAFRARSVASSASVTMALRPGFTESMRSRRALTTSKGESALERMRSASSVAS